MLSIIKRIASLFTSGAKIGFIGVFWKVGQVLLSLFLWAVIKFIVVFVVIVGVVYYSLTSDLVVDWLSNWMYEISIAVAGAMNGFLLQFEGDDIPAAADIFARFPTVLAFMNELRMFESAFVILIAYFSAVAIRFIRWAIPGG